MLLEEQYVKIPSTVLSIAKVEAPIGASAFHPRLSLHILTIA